MRATIAKNPSSLAAHPSPNPPCLSPSDWFENDQASLEDEARRSWGGRMCLHAGELRFHHRDVNQEIIVRDDVDYFKNVTADVQLLE